MKSNTRIITHEFDYQAPKTVEELLSLLTRYEERASILAGGTDLVSQIKMGKASPEVVLDIRKLDGLKGIQKTGGVIRIGPVNSFRTVMEEFADDRVHAALHEAIYSIGKTQVLNMGTIGGNLANGSPKADTAPPLLVFGAQVKLAGEKGERTIDLQEFYKGANSTVMATNELLAEIRFEAMDPAASSAFEKKTRVGADISKISCAVAVKREGDNCAWCRIALGAAAPVPMRTPEAEALLGGQKVDQALIERASTQVSREINPPERGRISADYRRHLAGVIFKDAFWRAWNRSGETK